VKLNPEKCTFGVASGKFLGYLGTQRGIEANPDQISAILEMKSPMTIKEVQILNGHLASLNRFLNRSTDKYKPFLLAIKKTWVGFCWSEECEVPFQSLKAYLASPLLLFKLLSQTLFPYLAVSNTAVSASLIREDRGIRKPVYYVSKALIDAKIRYKRIEKVVLALFVTVRKLKYYFQFFPIVVLTDTH